MEDAAIRPHRFCFKMSLFLFLWALPAFGQQSLDEPQIPANFNVDLETAARLRPQLMAQSTPATKLRRRQHYLRAAHEAGSRVLGHEILMAAARWL